MSLTERDRHDAYEALQDTFGARTDIVIAMLQPATNLVTKDDLAVIDAAIRRDMSVLRDGLRGELADLRTGLKTEMADLRADLKTEMADLRTEVRTDIKGLEVALGERISAATQYQVRSMLLTIMGAVVLVLLAEVLRTAIG